jgi:hypothetical protein
MKNKLITQNDVEVHHIHEEKTPSHHRHLEFNLIDTENMCDLVCYITLGK